MKATKPVNPIPLFTADIVVTEFEREILIKGCKVVITIAENQAINSDGHTIGISYKAFGFIGGVAVESDYFRTVNQSIRDIVPDFDPWESYHVSQSFNGFNFFNPSQG